MLDNDNSKVTNIWAMVAPVTTGWSEGRVEVSSNGDKEYQVRGWVMLLFIQSISSG